MQRTPSPVAAHLRPSILAAAATLAVLGGATPAAGWAQASVAQATASVRSYDIPAQALGSTLTRIATESGQPISVDAELVRGIGAPAVRGSFTTEQAVQAAIAGSGLGLARTGSGALTVVRSPAPASSAAPASTTGSGTLAAVTVTAQAEHGGITEHTGSYTARSTSAATGLNLSLRKTPQSVTVITRQRLDEGGINNLGDALAQAPGILYQPMGSSVGGYNSIYSRGYSVSSLILDGIPIPSSAIAGYGAIQGLSTLNTDVYDSVTVVRGATGLMSGAGDPSATVLLTRKRPTSEGQASVSQSLGSWQQRRTVGDVGGPLNEAGTLRGRLVGAYEEGGGWQDGYHYDQHTVYGILEADLSSQTLATLAVEAGGNQGRGAGPYTGYGLSDVNGHPTPFGRSDNAHAEWSGFRDRRASLTAVLEHRFNDDWKLKAAYHRNQVKTHQRFGLAADWPEADGTLGLHLRSYRIRNEADSLGLKLDGKYDLFGRKHDVVVGFNGSWSDENTPDWYVDWNTLANVYTWNRQTPEPDWASLYEFGWRNKVEQYGLYSATRLQATEQVSVLAGLRVTHWRDRELDEGGSVIGERKENGVLTPYLGLTADITPTLSAYTSYTTIFNPQYSRDVTGRLLDPEEGTNIEAGLKGEWLGGRLNASAAVFQVRKDNLAVLDGGNLTPAGDDAYRAEDDTKGRGWELEMSGEPVPGWRVQGGYTRMLTRDSSGLRLNNDQPKHLFKLFTTWTPASLNRLTVGGGATWQSDTYTDWVDDSWRELYTQKGYAVVNLMARYAFTPQLSLTVNFNNVFDKVYRTDVSGHNYGAERHVLATLKYQF